LRATTVRKVKTLTNGWLNHGRRRAPLKASVIRGHRATAMCRGPATIDIEKC
jgi:hypothetical protein